MFLAVCYYKYVVIFNSCNCILKQFLIKFVVGSNLHRCLLFLFCSLLAIREKCNLISIMQLLRVFVPNCYCCPVSDVLASDSFTI